MAMPLYGTRFIREVIPKPDVPNRPFAEMADTDQMPAQALENSMWSVIVAAVVLVALCVYFWIR